MNLKRPPYRHETREDLLRAAYWVRQEMRKYRLEEDTELQEALAFMKTKDRERYERGGAELLALRTKLRKMLFEFYADYRKHAVDQERQ